MSDFEDVLARYVAACRSAGAPEWSGPADETDVAELQAAVAPLVVPDQLIALWRHGAEGSSRLVDAGDLVSPQIALEMWREHRRSDWPPFPPTLLPIAFASHTYLTVELGYPGSTSGGALLRVPFEEIEPVAPDLAAALEFVASAISERQVRWNGIWWDGADIEELQRQRAANYLWPTHLTAVTSVTASLPLTWPSEWQRAAGINPADAEPRGATVPVASLETTSPGTRVRIAGRVQGLVGSGAGSLVTLADDTATVRCWCPSRSDPFFAVRKGDVIEVDIAVQDADEAASSGDPSQVLDGAPNGRFIATTIRPGSVEPSSRK